jgi:hypothetical protein
MLRRLEFKKRGKNAFYRNWKSCILICFVFAILVGGTVISIRNTEVNSEINVSVWNLKGDNNSEIVNDFINGITGKSPIESEFLNNTKGVLGTISNNVSKTGSFLFGILNALNQALFKDRVWASVIIIIGASLSFLYWVFGSKVLEVGKARFFLENRKYTKTKANKMILPYRIGKTTHIAYTMFVKNIYNILWYLTLVGGVIKSYSYMMVPYILAENPKIKTRDAIKLSRDMMNGYKWEVFKLDLSFIGWGILGIITFNISNLVFTTPYMNATKAEIYMYLRDLAKTRGIKNAKLLKDTNLEGDIVLGEYPVYDYMLKSSKPRKWLTFNYNRDYSFWNIVLLFFAFAFLGWIWEVLLFLFQTGSFVNRGALHGPWLPIYGAGGIAMLVLLKKVRKNPFVYFIFAMIVSGIIEYFTSVYLEIVHHMAWWDYTGFFLNINGRVCLEGLMLFGICGVAVTYVLAPVIANVLDKIDKNIKMFLCVGLVLLIAGDFYISGKNPNIGEGVTTEVVENSKIKDRLRN